MRSIHGRWLLLLGFALALVLFSARNITQDPVEKDAEQSLRMAVNLAHHGVMSLEESPPYLPSEYREPVPVLVLAAGIRVTDQIFGRAADAEYFSGPRIEHLKDLNILWLMLLSFGVIWAIETLAPSLPAGLAAILLVNVSFSRSPEIVDNLYSDLPAAAILLLASVSLVAAIRARTGFALFAGALFGVLCLIKAAALYVFFGIIAALWAFYFFPRGRAGLGTALRSTALLAAAFACVVTPWTLRNYLQLGSARISERAGVVLMCRAIKDRMSPTEYLGAFYVWAPGRLRPFMGRELGFSPQDLQRGGRLQHLNRSPQSDFYDDDLRAEQEGRPQDAISYYRRSRAERVKAEREFAIRGDPQPALAADEALKHRAMTMILAHPLRHLAATIPFLWRGAPIAFPVLIAAFWVAWRGRANIGIFGLPAFGIVMFYGLLSHFIPRYGVPVMPVIDVLGIVFACLIFRFAARSLPPDPIAQPEPGARGLLIALVACALTLGCYGRFTGLGLWPLGVDEFYISRSIDNVLRSGWPKFLCGGYYVRGLSYQYLVALLRLAGLTPELAGRWVSAVSSVLALPAAYLIGRRLQGPAAGWLCVVILAASVWEIEMARFARMYAPFQTIFTWYLVFFMRYTLDRSGKALAAMIGLSILGVLTWEGGALLGIANLIPPLVDHDHGRLRRKNWLYLAGMVAFAVLLYAATRDLRGFAVSPDADAVTETVLPAIAATPAPHRVIWMALFAVPALLALASVGWMNTFRRRPLALAGLGAALGVALAHQFLVCGAVLMLALLLRWIDAHELFDRRALRYGLALTAALLFWLAYGALAQTWEGSSTAAAIVQHMGGFPDVFDQVARPWGRSIPHLGLGVFIALGILTVAVLTDPRAATPSSGAVSPPTAPSTGAASPIPVLLAVLIFMVLGVGISNAPRIETRYSFFLYPLIVALCITAIQVASARMLGPGRSRGLFTGTIAVLLFMLSEDFQPRHVAHIDSAAINFRIGMTADQRDHYYPRNDVRSVVPWLAAHAHPGDFVISGIPSIDQYYPRTDFFYLDAEDERYETYACDNGGRDRWTNHPLLYKAQALQPLVATGHAVFVMLYHDRVARILSAASERGWRAETYKSSPFAGVDIVELNRR